MRINIDFYEFSELRNQYLALINELEAYRKNQIELILNGKRSSPVEIATACMVQEEGSYMRDSAGVSGLTATIRTPSEVSTYQRLAS